MECEDCVLSAGTKVQTLNKYARPKIKKDESSAAGQMTLWRNARGFLKRHLFHLCVCAGARVCVQNLHPSYFFAFGEEGVCSKGEEQGRRSRSQKWASDINICLMIILDCWGQRPNDIIRFPDVLFGDDRIAFGNGTYWWLSQVRRRKRLYCTAQYRLSKSGF